VREHVDNSGTGFTKYDLRRCGAQQSHPPRLASHRDHLSCRWVDLMEQRVVISPNAADRRTRPKQVQLEVVASRFGFAHLRSACLTAVITDARVGCNVAVHGVWLCG
jgi:hypothetical protein